MHRMRRQLIVMVKEPRPGRVKTRLGRDIGMTEAAWWFRHQVARLLREVDDPRWHLSLAVSPDHTGLQSRVWPAHLPRIGQGTGDLGDRMGRLLRRAPPGPVCIIGADIPDIRRGHIAAAFAALGPHDTVFGPAMDGGFWLVGLRRSTRIPSSLFNKVRWSSKGTLADTLASVPDARPAFLPTLRDVDRAADLPDRRR